MADDNVQRLAAAGLLEEGSLDAADRELIERLSTAEINTIIKIATELYPDDRSIVKLGNLETGRFRIMIPL
jgi:hypothetical protein